MFPGSAIWILLIAKYSIEETFAPRCKLSLGVSPDEINDSVPLVVFKCI